MRIFKRYEGFGDVHVGTEWVITHNLGYYPIIRVYSTATDGNDLWEKRNELVPLQIIHNSTNQVTIVFTESKTGTVAFF